MAALELDDQWKEFKALVEARRPGVEVKIAQGASNQPFALPGGFRFANYNFNTFDFAGLRDAGGSVAIATRLMLPPDAFLHVALVFGPDSPDPERCPDPLAALQARVEEIRGEVGAVKHARVILGEQGAYLVENLDPKSVDTTGALGAPIVPSAAYFADVRRPRHLETVETAFVDYLGKLLPAGTFERLDTGGGAGGATLDPATIDFPTLVERVRAFDAEYPDELLWRYHAALNHLDRKHFVLLTGISGTGKTLIARAYAYAVFGLPDLDVESREFRLISVRPNWTDPTHLLGFMDAVAGTYRRPPFLESYVYALDNPHRPVFVCLDEMNLAQPEHYFADVMSAMETGGKIHLHDDDPAVAGIDRDLPWPKNLYISGTVNVDETTARFSPKLLDRANVIEMSDVNVNGYATRLRDAAAAKGETAVAGALTDGVIALLARLGEILKPHHLHFGYRIIREIAYYVAFASPAGIDNDAKLDMQIEQKIITKLRGGVEQEVMLRDLETALATRPRSLVAVRRMLQDLADYQSFQYWR